MGRFSTDDNGVNSLTVGNIQRAFSQRWKRQSDLVESLDAQGTNWVKAMHPPLARDTVQKYGGYRSFVSELVAPGRPTTYVWLSAVFWNIMRAKEMDMRSRTCCLSLDISQ